MIEIEKHEMAGCSLGNRILKNQVSRSKNRVPLEDRNAIAQYNLKQNKENINSFFKYQNWNCNMDIGTKENENRNMLRNNKPEGLLNAVRRYFRGIRMKTEHNGRKLSNSKYFFLCFFLSLFLSSFLPFFLMFFFSFLLLSFLLPSFFFSFFLPLSFLFRNLSKLLSISNNHYQPLMS